VAHELFVPRFQDARSAGAVHLQVEEDPVPLLEYVPVIEQRLEIPRVRLRDHQVEELPPLGGPARRDGPVLRGEDDDREPPDDRRERFDPVPVHHVVLLVALREVGDPHFRRPPLVRHQRPLHLEHSLPELQHEGVRSRVKTLGEAEIWLRPRSSSPGRCSPGGS
jgi:hypothetical protein